MGVQLKGFTPKRCIGETKKKSKESYWQYLKAQEERTLTLIGSFTHLVNKSHLASQIVPGSFLSLQANITSPLALVIVGKQVRWTS